MILQARLDQLQSRYQAAPRWLRLLTPFLAGWVTVAAMPPWNVWPALWVGFSVLYLLTAWSETPWQTFWRGWLFGFGYFVFGLAWTANALTVEGSTYSWVIPIAICGLPALLAIFTGLPALCARRLCNLHSVPGYLAFCGFVTLFEWLRGHVFSGFPWNLYGYGWTSVLPVAQTASLVGIYGLTLLTIIWAALPGFLLAWPAKQQSKTICALVIYASLAVLWFWGGLRLEAHPTTYDHKFVLHIVQPSISQSMKWDHKKIVASFNKTLGAAEMGSASIPQGGTMLMIWPETAVSQDVMEDANAQDALKNFFTRYHGNFYLATGLLRWQPRGRDMDYYNSIGIYDRDLNLTATYDKSHLVPFGEYIPLSRWLPANPLVSLEGFQHGDGPSTMGIPLAVGVNTSLKISPLICYEVIFPGAVVRRGSNPGLLLNVTNDGWYGDTSGPRQHLAIARFRAIEEGVPLARAANTGISAVIDAYGRVLWQSRIFEVTAHDVDLPNTAFNITLYSKYGDTTALFLILILCIAGILKALRRRFT